MSITWSCRLSVAQYAALGRSAPAPRLECADCGEQVTFDGSYRRQVREAGVVHEIFVRRGFCRRCNTSEALLPEFVLRRRRDSTCSVGAAVLERFEVEIPPDAAAFYAGVPERTVRSWRQRFSERASELWQVLTALTLEWGGEHPRRTRNARRPGGSAIDAMALVWNAAQRRPTADVPPPWRLANVIVGGELIATRVSLPFPIITRLIARSRAPRQARWRLLPARPMTPLCRRQLQVNSAFSP